MRISQAGLILALGLALTGCQRFGSGGSSDIPQQQPAPLTPAPVGGVQQSQLAPPGAGTNTGNASQFPAAPGAANNAGNQQMASTGNSNAPSLSPETMIGRWTVTISGSDCDLFLSMTKWTGGYRAATRNCSGMPSNISAWDVKGNQVILSDNIGNQLAAVQAAGHNHYQGTTTSGQSISLGR